VTGSFDLLVTRHELFRRRTGSVQYFKAASSSWSIRHSPPAPGYRTSLKALEIQPEFRCPIGDPLVVPAMFLDAAGRASLASAVMAAARPFCWWAALLPIRGESHAVDNALPLRAAHPERHRLPDERRAITHHFSVGGQEATYVGLYPDGQPVNSSSRWPRRIDGIWLMDAFATAVCWPPVWCAARRTMREVQPHAL